MKERKISQKKLLSLSLLFWTRFSWKMQITTQQLHMIALFQIWLTMLEIFDSNNGLNSLISFKSLHEHNIEGFMLSEIQASSILTVLCIKPPNIQTSWRASDAEHKLVPSSVFLNMKFATKTLLPWMSFWTTNSHTCLLDFLVHEHQPLGGFCTPWLLYELDFQFGTCSDVSKSWN